MKSALKRLTPEPLWNAARQGVALTRHLPEMPEAYLHPWRRQSMARLAALKDKYRGQRCFIIGNGPSLRQTDVSRLKNEFTFGMNRVYLAFEEWGFRTSFLVSVNDLVIEQCVDDFLALDMPRFFSWRSRKFFDGRELANPPAFLYTTYDAPKFARDARFRLWEGATVTYVCLQLAFHMGFEQAILIGVDHSFASKGEANKTVVSEGDDPNHFAPNYFGKGFRWQLPDLDTSEQAYWMARQAWESDGRQVLDATIGGKLQVFPKVDFAQVVA
ncbi:MAG: DUF115 domain-containing protein [Anaerolineae bacterium]|nr:MAG: DUF115 domain-containing protein [Anaerolineae bacterium]